MKLCSLLKFFLFGLFFPKDPSVNLECLSCLVALMITHDDIKKARVHPLIHISSNLKPHWYISMWQQVDSVQCIVTFKATIQKIICLLDYCIDTHFRGKTSIILGSFCVCGWLSLEAYVSVVGCCISLQINIQAYSLRRLYLGGKHLLCACCFQWRLLQLC